MRIAAVTMVYQGYGTLKRWCAHYGKLVGEENLYIISHGDDPVHREIASRSNVIGIPRTGLDRFDYNRHTALDSLASFLETYVDVVMRVDVDELVFVDPDLHADLASCLGSYRADAWFCLGFNVFAKLDEPKLDLERPYSEQRRLCVVASMYSKAVAGRNGVFIGFHGARDSVKKDASRMILPKGLYLAHVRHAETGGPSDGDSYTEMSRTRRAPSEELTIQERIASYPVVDAERELGECFAKMSVGFERNRPKRPNIWCVPRVKRNVAFELPDRFVGLF